MGKRANNLIAGRAVTEALRLGHCAMMRIIIKKGQSPFNNNTLQWRAQLESTFPWKGEI